MQAQDARTVREPQIPALCQRLTAVLTDAAGATDNDDTRRLQQAIDQCGAGHAVELAAAGERSAFLAGPLQLHGGVTLLIDAGVTLYASTDPRVYDTGAHTCGSNDASGKGCRPFIEVAHSQGDAIMGAGVIDGQGGQRMTGKNESWWQLSRRAQKEDSMQNVPHLLVLENARDFVLYQITLRNSLKYHVVLRRVDGFTAWGVRLNTPASARNTDGIDPISSRNVTVIHSFIHTGDDNISIKSGNGIPSEQISIIQNHFYTGHGMSIGSNTDGGIRHVLVDDLSMDGTTSGLRIKSDISRGGLVSDIHFQNVCLRDVRAPIDVDTAYTRSASGTLIPEYQAIYFEHIPSLNSGKMIFLGIDQQHPLGIELSDVIFDGLTDVSARHAHFHIGAGGVQPLPSGEDVQLSGTASAGSGIACAARFMPFPEPAPAPTPTPTPTPEPK